jgi:hypothetical protein
VSHINEFCAHYESMGLIATVFHEPDSRGLDPAMTKKASLETNEVENVLVSAGASFLADPRLDKADRLEVKAIVRVYFREYRLHDASGHHDLAGLQPDAA